MYVQKYWVAERYQTIFASWVYIMEIIALVYHLLVMLNVNRKSKLAESVMIQKETKNNGTWMIQWKMIEKGTADNFGSS